MNYRITDDIDRLLNVLPEDIAFRLIEIDKQGDLLEVVMDLGRRPSARYVDDTKTLSEREITSTDLDFVVQHVGMFDADNRAGMERTLHRISAMRNRQGEVIGLTCRIGRAVYGTIDIIEDIITSGKSVLLLGSPGVGKTTLLRESARILSQMRRVVIVDTSNEIGGDGDVPHPAIGGSRRMQVPQPALQHEVMIEAVENHNPEVIIIDEIGRELEALAARTIAERGVQLVGTAHGNMLENLLRNPTLSDLVGGIQSVTLSDEEARRRRTQKSVLERRSPPTFDVLIEIKDRNTLLVHEDLAASVDAHLRGRPLPVEMRHRTGDAEIEVLMVYPESSMQIGREGGRTRDRDLTQRHDSRRGKGARSKPQSRAGEGGFFYNNLGNGNGGNGTHQATTLEGEHLAANGFHEDEEPQVDRKPKMLKIYAYGVARNRLYGAADQLGVNIELVENMTKADVVVTLKSYYRRRPKLIVDAENRKIPIHVLRANTANQVEDFLVDVLDIEARNGNANPLEQALYETHQAIRKIQTGEAFEIDLSPQERHIRRRQHEIVNSENLGSQSFGKEPKRFVRIFAPEN